MLNCILALYWFIYFPRKGPNLLPHCHKSGFGLTSTVHEISVYSITIDIFSRSVLTTLARILEEKACPFTPGVMDVGNFSQEDCFGQAGGVPLSALVRQHFASVFASLLPLHSHGTQAEQQKAAAVLQGNMLSAAQLTEDERDNLIRRLMVCKPSAAQSLIGCGIYLHIVVIGHVKL